MALSDHDFKRVVLVNPETGEDYALMASGDDFTGSAIAKRDFIRAILVNPETGDDYKASSSGESTALQVVTVTTGDEARPPADVVFWMGGDTQPTNMVDGDAWFAFAGTQTPPDEPLPQGMHSVYGEGDYPHAMTTADNVTPITLATYFYTYGGTVTGWKVAGGRLFVPTGSALIGKTAEFYLFTPAEGVAPDLSAPVQTKSKALVQGWNDALFDTATVVAASQHWLIGYRCTSSAHYVALGSALTSDFVAATDASPVVQSDTAGLPSGARNWLREGTGGTSNGGNDFAWGIDCIVEEA